MPSVGAKPGRRLVERGIETLQSGGDEQKNVDVHRIRVDEHDRAHSFEAPRRFRHPQGALHHARDETTLAIQKEKSDYSNQWRERGGKCSHRAKEPAAGKTEPTPQKRN